MPSAILPLGPRMLVQPDAAPDMLRGLHLPERVADGQRPEAGEVIAVSVELLGEFPVGTRIVFAPYSGIELAVEGKPVMILSKAEVLGVLLPAEVAVAAPA